ncbi:multiple sugar transport system permease protein [Actinopolymorpha cephalotaxi]|uniref:Multiple sugar transport system permease protein n=1 Tax=Actinopolymorpha cephalotaxi TaxID=504797 RepID=A0A1I2WTE5_9ACTN|nr:sugar ABC transporter permease [Actinopolymorpha cephalotaxi]NYH85090.1 multiple sugar transport system permease protein [Actinopolymorpha cephalotaxi]SFH03869.1 multiple sugar transport system permease protein [Actinopolymorpha cephalotaxi]
MASISAVRREPTGQEPHGSLRRRIWAARPCYLLMLPGLVLIVMFSFYPLVMSWYYAFFDWSGFEQAKHFVGWQNFRELMGDEYFWKAFGRSAWFAGVATPVELLLSLVVAIVLNDRSLRLAPLFRTLFFVPVVTTTAIVSIVMSMVFSAFNGPANEVLRAFHLTERPVGFLTDPHLVMWTAIGIFVWKWFGQPMIYWLAGLQTIPSELYEAAQVDGAGWWRRSVSITAPLLTPFAVIITLIVLVGNMQVFAFMQALTHGGPYFSTEVMELYIYRTAFGAQGQVSAQRLGYASAAGVLFGLLLIVLAVAQITAVRRLRRGPGTPAESR